jgi:hypothetical protein
VFWRSDDDGVTWHEQYPDVPIAKPDDPFIEVFPINKVEQVDSLHAYAVGSKGLILETSDAGNTWNKLRCPVTSDLVGINCHDLIEGIIVGVSPGVILTLSEVGWDTVAPIHPDIPEYCHSYGDGKYCVITASQELYTTQKTWLTIDSVAIPQWTPDSMIHLGYNQDPVIVSNCLFLSGDTILEGMWPVVGFTPDWPVLLRTYDGGQSWNFVVDSSAIGGFATIYQISGDSLLSLRMGIGDDDPGFVKLSTDLGSTWVIDTLLFNKKFQIAPYSWSVAHMQDGSLLGSYTTELDNINPPQVTPGCVARLTIDPQSSVTTPQPFENHIILYPNPASSFLNFESPAGAITILDPLGRSYEGHQTGNTLDVSSLPSGVYFISDGHSRAKFVKQ